MLKSLLQPQEKRCYTATNLYVPCAYDARPSPTEANPVHLATEGKGLATSS